MWGIRAEIWFIIFVKSRTVAFKSKKLLKIKNDYFLREVFLFFSHFPVFFLFCALAPSKKLSFIRQKVLNFCCPKKSQFLVHRPQMFSTYSRPFDCHCIQSKAFSGGQTQFYSLPRLSSQMLLWEIVFDLTWFNWILFIFLNLS